MPNYVTAAEFQARFEDDAEVTRLTKSDDTTGAVDSTIITEVLDGVEGIMDSYFGMRYSVPIDTTQAANAAVVQRVAIAMARHELYAQNGSVPEPVGKEHDEAMEYLKDIASGEAILPQAATHATTTGRSGIGVVLSEDDDSTSSKRLFTRSRMANI